jgi:hypothetical protein
MLLFLLLPPPSLDSELDASDKALLVHHVIESFGIT